MHDHTGFSHKYLAPQSMEPFLKESRACLSLCRCFRARLEKQEIWHDASLFQYAAICLPRLLVEIEIAPPDWPGFPPHRQLFRPLASIKGQSTNEWRRSQLALPPATTHKASCSTSYKIDASMALFVRYVSNCTFWSAVLTLGWHYHNLIAHACTKLSQARCSIRAWDMLEARCSITWASLFFQHFSTLYHYSFRSLGGPKSQTNSSRFLGGMHSVDIVTCPTSQVLGAAKAKPIQAGFLVE